MHKVQGTWSIQGDSEDEDVDAKEVHAAVEKEETHKTGLIIKIEEPAAVILKGIFSITEVEVKIIRSEGDEDSGMATTPLIVTETTGIEILMASGNSNRGRRWDSNRGQGHSDQGRGRKWNPSQQYHNLGYQQQQQYSDPSHYRPPQWVININIQSYMNSIHILSNSNISLRDHQHPPDRLQTYVNCVKIKAIMIINANLQVILWSPHKKLSIKVAHITTKT